MDRLGQRRRRRQPRHQLRARRLRAGNNNGTPDDFADDADWPNGAGLVFAEEQGSFLVGAAAALKSQTGKIGFIGGVEIDLIKKFEAGYIAGAKAVNPDIEILVPVHHAAAGLHRLQRPGQGQGDRRGDVRRRRRRHLPAAGGSGLGVFEAAKEAGEPGAVWAIGVDSDQYSRSTPTCSRTS